MTAVQPNPGARYGRLLRRAQDAHAQVSGLVDDLTAEEGLALARVAQDDLSAVCLRLEQLFEGARTL